MLSLANQFVARATRFILIAQDEPALWTVSARGRGVGSLVCQAGALSARLGAPVRLESLPV